MKNFIIKLSIVCTGIFFGGCANYHYMQANKEFNNLQYADAIKHYTTLIEDEKVLHKVISKEYDHDAEIKLANCYRLINDIKKAEPLFKELVKYPGIEPITMFHYARILMSKEDYANAKIWLNNYLAKVPNDMVAQMLVASCNSVNKFMNDTTLYAINEIDFPDFESIFSPTPYKNGLVFTADKKVKKKSEKDPWTGNSYFNLYFSEKDKDGHWLSPQLLKGEINGRYHEGPAAFTKSGKVAYFTRSNYYKNKLRKSSKNENNLKIFKAKLVNGEWAHLEEMPFSSDEYSVGHPSLSYDEKTIYFISDMPGGFGKTDIYSSKFDGKTWSKPENLGAEINSAGNEMFPFMGEDGTFYFSSDAHSNMGGLDVFATSYDDVGKKWLQPENISYPLNSSNDDFGFVINKDKKTGFISSNRKSSDKIYEFEKIVKKKEVAVKKDPVFNLSGVITVKGKGNPIEGVIVKLFDQSSVVKNPVDSTITDKSGRYKLKLKGGIDYDIFMTKENYFARNGTVSTKNRIASEDFIRDFEMDEIIIDKPIVLENIYYDVDKWDIRPEASKELDKLVKILNDNPNIIIELGSHTDRRASAQYNLILSDKRAKAAVFYLNSQGINMNRLKWKGYGETVFVACFGKNAVCTEEEHQKNRRTEFKVIKIMQPGLTNK